MNQSDEIKTKNSQPGMTIVGKHLGSFDEEVVNGANSPEFSGARVVRQYRIRSRIS